MEINIQGSNSFNVSQRIRDYIFKRVVKLNYFKTQIDHIDFHLSHEKLKYKITANLSIRKFGAHNFEASAEEMYTAIDKIIHKIDVKINREKTKMQKHSTLGHEALVNFFTEHDNDNPEPTKEIMVHQKPSTLEDAYMQMQMEGIDFYGFTLIQDNTIISPAFLRKLDDDIIYLFRKNGFGYTEFSLKINGKIIEEDSKIRDIELEKMNLLDAQKKILDQDYHFNIYLDKQNKINFLFKEDNGKWKLISEKIQ